VSALATWQAREGAGGKGDGMSNSESAMDGTGTAAGKERTHG
jgi:hypothetical protein